MILLLVFIFFALFGIALDAQTLPTLYEVEGVPSGEFLNVREGPSASTDIAEVISNNDVVEVLRTQDGWGFIGLGETSGWVSMNYLTANYLTAVQHPNGDIPLPVVCYGTEPFWSISIENAGANYLTPDEPKRAMSVQSSLLALNGFTFQLTEGERFTHSLISKSSFCSDGMSDREFGMTALLHLQSDEGNYVHHGCCTFQIQ